MKRDRVLAHNSGQSNEKTVRQKVDNASASSSSAASTGSDNYDVFLSFSGKDIRKTFADHLYNGLVDASIRVFRDNNELREGEKIGTNLLQAIKNSKISIPILSQNYASSKWCLQELVEMTECIKGGHVVLPIFYHVEPTDVRNQKGGFGEAFSCLSRKYPEDVEKWKVALQEMASLKGWESEKTADGREGDLVKMVVKRVLSELKKAFQLNVTEHLVGINNVVESILRLLDDNSSATQIVGIYGMGGIGKTTLAKAVHNKLSNQFQHHSFIADIRESSRCNGIFYLQNQLIRDLKETDQVSNKDEGINILGSRFKCKKVLILLDDVDDIKQIRALVGKYNWFEMGSRIIITTRSRSVLDKAEVKCKYELEEMAEDESLVLFSRHAFRRDSPLCEFESLSRAIVSTTGGLPLALEVIGSFLYGQSSAFWEDKLKKLQEVPHMEVQEKLRISYDTLDWEVKEIYLDIACFFIGENLRYASYMWDACNFFPKMGIETLSFMSLIKIGDHGEVQMHDQLRDLGREIVRQEDYNVPMNRSRLWMHKEALAVLEKNKGIQKDRVRALCLDKDGTEREFSLFGSELETKFTTEQFETLPNLRFLAVCGAKLIGDSRSLLPELRWLIWRGCPAFVATSFCLEKLVILNLSGSDISEFWEGWGHLKMAKQLKVLNLRNCDCLKVTPNLSSFRNVEIFQLKACKHLRQIHPSIGEAKGLVSLDLQQCSRLQELPQEMGKLEELKELYIGETNIEEIPPFIGSLKKLEVLYAAGCTNLVELPDSIGHLVNLLTLDLSGCPGICKLPESIGSLVKLQRLLCGPGYEGSCCRDSYLAHQWEKLNRQYGGICELPVSTGDLKNLKFLHIYWSNKLKNLPSTINKLGNLEELEVLQCHNLVGEVHIDGLSSLKILRLSGTAMSGFCGTFDKLSRLEKLTLDMCPILQSLPKLPASLTVLYFTCECCTFPQLSHLIHLKKLIVRGCPLLKSMHISKLANLEELDVSQCHNLVGEIHIDGLSSLKILRLSCTAIFGFHGTFDKLSCLEKLELDNCRMLHSLPKLPASLTVLKVTGQHRTFPQLFHLIHLKKFTVEDCPLLESMPELPLGLLELSVSNCGELKELPSLSRLEFLSSLSIAKCWKLSNLDSLEHLESLRCLCLLSNGPILKDDQVSGFEKLKNLEYLSVVDCESLVRTDVSQLTQLAALDFCGCRNLLEIKGLGRLKNLRSLNFLGCPSIEPFPDISCFHCLRFVRVDECSTIPDVRPVTKARYLGGGSFKCLPH